MDEQKTNLELKNEIVIINQKKEDFMSELKKLNIKQTILNNESDKEMELIKCPNCNGKGTVPKLKPQIEMGMDQIKKYQSEIAFLEDYQNNLIQKLKDMNSD